MASIRRRGKSYFVDYRENGKRIRKVVSSREEAELILKKQSAKKSHEQDQGRLAPGSLKDLFSRFFIYSQETHSPNTQERYRSILGNFQRFLLKNSISNVTDLNQSLIKSFLKFRQDEGASENTVNSELTVIRKVFTLAIKWGLASSNPTDDVSKLEAPAKQAPQYLSKEDCQKLLTQCDEWLKPIVLTILHTGLRKGEIEGLRWQDINFENGVINIRVRDKWTPKDNERTIPINKTLKEVLLKQIQITGAYDFVFLSEKLKPIDRNKIRLRLIKAAAQASLPELTQVSTLRNTFIAQLIERGVALSVIQKLVGHSDINTTILYEKFEDKHMRNAIEDINFND